MGHHGRVSILILCILCHVALSTATYVAEFGVSENGRLGGLLPIQFLDSLEKVLRYFCNLCVAFSLDSELLLLA